MIYNDDIKKYTALKLFSGNANVDLARKIVKYIGISLGSLNVSRFKDGEVYVQIQENVRGADVFLIQPTSPDVNQNLMELLIMIDAFKRASASRVTAVVPYYGYARQDRKIKAREPITAKLVANLITKAGADRVLTIDLHSGQIQGFFDIPLDNLTAISLIANYFLKKNLSDIIAVSPDANGTKNARILAKALNVPLAIIDKRRDQPNSIAEMRVIGEVKDRVCVILDDIIDTAGTVLEASKSLIKCGAKEIYVAATHGIFSEPALERLNHESIKEVVITDTVNTAHKIILSKLRIISVADLLAEAIIRIHTNKSISSLFDEINNKNG